MSETQVKTKKEVKSEVVCDIPRSENDVYRISQGEGNGTAFVDLRIFFRSKDGGNLLPTKKGIAIKAQFRKEVLVGLQSAKQAVAPPAAAGDQKVQSVAICDIPISESEIYRISKGRGKEACYVDLRVFFKNGEGVYSPTRKGIAIWEAALDGVIQGLQKVEAVAVSPNAEK